MNENEYVFFQIVYFCTQNNMVITNPRSKEQKIASPELSIITLFGCSQFAHHASLNSSSPLQSRNLTYFNYIKIYYLIILTIST
jgi:hypothetical protein